MFFFKNRACITTGFKKKKIESDLFFEKGIIKNIENDFQKYLKKHDIDYIWYPDLSCVPILDFPYVVTIWNM